MRSSTTSAVHDGTGRVCNACNTDNAWNRRFCRSCGAKVVATCPKCDFGNGLTDMFCGGCGCEIAVAAAKTSAPAQGAAKRPQRARPPQPPAPRASRAAAPNPKVRALAQQLADLNTTEVQEPARRPPPVPSAEQGGTEPDDLGQEQIDALFG